MGVRSDHLFPGCRCCPVGHHVLYYRIRDDVIEIVHILHERMDPMRHVK
ncbi:MAG: type II toxin-antitoxin system RelE/ParE family toxin [Thermomicrobiales bacterium]